MPDIITEAKQTWGGYTVTINGKVTWIPHDPDNADFQGLQAWITAGGVIETSVAGHWPQAESEQ